MVSAREIEAFRIPAAERDGARPIGRLTRRSRAARA